MKAEPRRVKHALSFDYPWKDFATVHPVVFV